MTKDHVDCLALEQRLDALVEQLAQAIRLETAAYRMELDDAELQASTCVAISEATDALLAIPAADLATLDANGYGYNYRLGLAMAVRRDLIMEGDYSASNQDVRVKCRLVDALLEPSKYDALPMLWHINGQPFDQRPDADQLAAAAEGAHHVQG